MTLDPISAGAITIAINKTVSWLWEKYGQSILETVANQSNEQIKWKSTVNEYLENLYEQVRWVRILGKAEGQEFEKIFTDVYLLDEVKAQSWYSFKEPKDGRLLSEKNAQKQRSLGLDVVLNEPNLFILGKPGSGKTTFLKNIALEAIKRNIPKIPFLISLKSLSDSSDSIDVHMTKTFRGYEIPRAKSFIQKLLSNGECILLFDSLDEVNVEGDKRINIINMLKTFIDSYPSNQYVITSRTATTDFSFLKFNYVEMADFNDEQKRSFIWNWFDLPEQRQARFACWHSLTSKEHTGLTDLAKLPLFLSLLCLVYEERNEFPPNKEEIYEEAVRALLSKWDSSRNIKRDEIYRNLTLKNKKKLISIIAVHFFSKQEFFFKEREVIEIIDSFIGGLPRADEENVDTYGILKSLESQHGLIIEQAKGIYSFAHLSLQQYFVATYIVENEARGTLNELINNHLEEESWSDVFILTSSMLNDSTSFFKIFLVRLLSYAQAKPRILEILKWVNQRVLAIDITEYSDSAIKAFYLYLILTYIRNITQIGERESAKLLLNQIRAKTRKIAVQLDMNIALHLFDLTIERILTPQFVEQFPFTKKLIVEMSLINLQDIYLARNSKALISQLASLAIDLENDQLSEDLNTVFKTYEALPEITLLRSNIDKIVNKHFKNIQTFGLDQPELNQLHTYLDSNLLLLECLKVAYTPQRERIKELVFRVKL